MIYKMQKVNNMVFMFVKMIIMVIIVKVQIFNVLEAYVLMIYYLKEYVYIVKDMVLVNMENVNVMMDIMVLIVVIMKNV